MHGRNRLARRSSLHEPPLRLRLDPAALLRGARLSEIRILGHVAGRGAARSGPRSALHPPDRRRDGRGHGQRPLDRLAGGVRTHHGREHRGPRKTARRRESGHGDSRARLLRRQPVLRLRHGGLQGRASGGSAALVDRQVRRRHRQLDVAAPYGRFLDLPRLCRGGQPSGRLFARKPPLQGREIPENLAGRRRGERLRHDHGLPRFDRALCHVV